MSKNWSFVIQIGVWWYKLVFGVVYQLEIGVGVDVGNRCFSVLVLVF